MELACDEIPKSEDGTRGLCGCVKSLKKGFHVRRRDSHGSSYVDAANFAALD
jgi:hypothetical protein